MSEHVTGWAQGPDDVLEHDVFGQVHQAERPFHSNPQWIPVPGDPLPQPTEPDVTDGLFRMENEEAPVEFTPAGAFGHDYSYGQLLLFHQAWAQVWFEVERVRPLAVPVIDNDANDWRIAREMELRAAFEDANPDAYAVSIEWEGWDFSGLIFGSHSDRILRVETEGLPGNAATELTVSEDPLVTLNPKPEQVEAEIELAPLNLLIAPPKDGVVSGTYLPSAVTSTSQTAINYALAAFTEGSLGSIPAELVPAESNVEIPDAIFEDKFLPLTFEAQPWRRTRSLLLWIIPNTAIARRFSHGQVVEYDIALNVRSVFTPPRHRIRYFIDTVPYRRLDQRGDGLAGGARRVGRRTKTIQDSNRRGAGAIV